MKLAMFSTLSLSFLLIFASSIFAQQYETIYPNGLTLIARKPLPQKVYLAQQNIVEIEGRFFTNEKPHREITGGQGSGFIEKKSGYVISARHNIIEAMVEIWSEHDLPYYIDEKGIPVSKKYHYKFYAIVYTATSKVEYPLEVVGIGPLGTHADVMAFRPLKQIPVNGLELFDNPRVGDEVYASGFTGYTTHYHQENGWKVVVNAGSTKFNFENIVAAVLEDKKITSFGVKRIYKLFGGIEFGFSGGPVLDRHGQVIAVTIEESKNFLYAISSQDVRALIKSIK